MATPKVLLGTLGEDGHDRGIHVVAGALADIGWAVSLGDLFDTPEELVSHALEADVEAIGVSTLAAGHKTLVPRLLELLAERGRDDILVVVGGIIPEQDHAVLKEAGVAAVFGPGESLTDLSNRLAGLVETRRTRFHNRRFDSAE